MDELGGNSWKQAFRNQLTEIKKKIDKKNIKPSQILLTGGGARMNFIQEICKEVFPSSPYQMDTEPELCITRGLARWGRLSVNTTQFEEKINQFIHGDLRKIVKKYFDNYQDKLVDILTDGLLNEVMKSSLKDFRNGKIKNKKDLESKIQQRGKEWLQDSDVQKKRTEPILKKQVKDLEKEVQIQIDSICKNYGLERGTFGLQSEHPINFNLDLDKLNDINAGVQSLSKEDLPTTIGSSILLYSGAYIATTFLITDATVELILAPITGGLSVILGIIFLPILKKYVLKKNLTDDKIEEIIRNQKSKLKENIKQALGEQKELFDKIIEATTQAIKTAIKEKIDDVRILLH